MYSPNIESSEIIEEFHFDDYRAQLLGNIKSVGIQYLYILAVYKSEETEPCVFITSEENSMAKELDGGSHFLCAFQDEKHLNFGTDNGWADLNKFKEKSCSMASSYVSKGHL